MPQYHPEKCNGRLHGRHAHATTANISKAQFPRLRYLAPACRGEMNEANGFCSGAATGSRDACHGYGNLGARVREGTFGHGTGDRCTDGTAGCDERRGHAEHLDLSFV